MSNIIPPLFYLSSEFFFMNKTLLRFSASRLNAPRRRGCPFVGHGSGRFQSSILGASSRQERAIPVKPEGGDSMGGVWDFMNKTLR
jgi:hypothetical protein